MTERKLCKYCHSGNSFPDYKENLHAKCRRKYQAEHIPKNQKPELSRCPRCRKTFSYWQLAALHAEETNHWGNYNIGEGKK